MKIKSTKNKTIRILGTSKFKIDTNKVVHDETLEEKLYIIRITEKIK